VLNITYGGNKDEEGGRVPPQSRLAELRGTVVALRLAPFAVPQLRRRDNSLVAEPEPELNKPAPPLNRLYSRPLPLCRLTHAKPSEDVAIQFSRVEMRHGTWEKLDALALDLRFTLLGISASRLPTHGA